MPLTTEQKINLLILAGFEPWFHKERGKHPRIAKGAFANGVIRGPVLYANLWREWSYSNSNPTYVKIRAKWEEMFVYTIPDELIYQAIETTG